MSRREKPDADLDHAAAQVTAAGYGSAGQRCMAISAVVAVGEAGDALVDRLRERAASVVVGPGRDEKSEMGPLVTAAARDRVVGYIADGVGEGGTLVVDGRGTEVLEHEGVSFYTRAKVVTSRWPHVDRPVEAHYNFPTA